MARRAASLRVPAPRTSCRVCALPHPSSASRQKYSPPGNNLSTGFYTDRGSLFRSDFPKFKVLKKVLKICKIKKAERDLSKICQDEPNRIKVRINGIKRSARERETSVIGAPQHRNLEHHFLNEFINQNAFRKNSKFQKIIKNIWKSHQEIISKILQKYFQKKNYDRRVFKFRKITKLRQHDLELHWR